MNNDSEEYMYYNDTAKTAEYLSKLIYIQITISYDDTFHHIARSVTQNAHQ